MNDVLPWAQLLNCFSQRNIATLCWDIFRTGWWESIKVSSDSLTIYLAAWMLGVRPRSMIVYSEEAEFGMATFRGSSRIIPAECGLAMSCYASACQRLLPTFIIVTRPAVIMPHKCSSMALLLIRTGSVALSRANTPSVLLMRLWMHLIEYWLSAWVKKVYPVWFFF